MSLKMWMPSFLRRKRFVRSMREAEYPVEKAFSYRGQDYFRFVDPSNVPAGRMLAAMKYYLPLTTQCNADYLKWHCQALNEILSNPKSINLQRVLQLVLHMEERLSWIPSPADVYKYAAVLYMDETENPYTFDEEYAEKKIARWREDPNGPLAFFLTEPILKLVPSLKRAGTLQKTSLMVRVEREVLQLKTLLQVLSTNPNFAEDASRIQSLISTLRHYGFSEGSRQMSTS